MNKSRFGMQVYFHIGAAKTGSTALQNALFNSSEYLEGKGVFYPRNPAAPRSRNHRIFATRLAPLDRLPRHMMSAFRDQAAADELFLAFHAHLKDLIRDRRPRLLLLSTETMFARIDPAYQSQLREAIDSLGAPTLFMAYLRRPSERYASELQQHLRRSARLMQPRPYSYRENILRYEAVFGAGCVRPHLFHASALRDGDVVADFCERYLEDFGIEHAELARGGGGSGNVSLSAESMTIMQAYRRDFHADSENQPTPGSEKLLRLLWQADQAVGGARPRLRPEIAEAIDYQSKDPLWLRERYGVVFPDFDYAALEQERLRRRPARLVDLGQIISIDGAVRKAILEWLMASGWGGKSRPAWLQALAAAPI